ncbi:hypothetical protein [Clostridium manihotivorum]|uniref:Uncharacterized protein n=1 Tax=Clostridium manihotivorum TaxID=2320868 RepID=A0A3R5QUH2_9CLOT|nr:hypothetical protein [Clostridium manihotivorum]QAA32793.1 hypothetical protein C1I91_14725 [Clostridium manihotivorum]
MKKIIMTVAASLVLTIGISSALTSKLNSVQNVPVAATSLTVENELPKESTTTVLESETKPTSNAEPQTPEPKNTEKPKEAETKPAQNTSAAKSSSSSSGTAKSSTSSEQKKTTTVAKADTKPKQSLSRGGSPIPSQKNTYTQAPANTSSSKYGELLSWSQASGLIPRGSTIQVTDLSTGKTFSIKRTFGTNHLDGEASASSDTSTIKSIWGGFSWVRRPVIVNINGRKIAASMTAMPHAGVDSAPALATVSNRSDGYGKGENLDAVKNNGMDGVIDIHFLNSTRHKDNKTDPQHQAAILKAAGK